MLKIGLNDLLLSICARSQLLKIYLLYFLAVLALHCFAWPFSGCGKRGLPSAVAAAFSLRWLLLLEHRLRMDGDQQLQLAFSREVLQSLWHTGLAAPQDVGSSQSKDQTDVPWTTAQVLNHRTTREAPTFLDFRILEGISYI